MSYQQAYGGYQQQPVYPALPAPGQPNNVVGPYGNQQQQQLQQQPQQQPQQHQHHGLHLPHLHLPFQQHHQQQQVAAPPVGSWNARQTYNYQAPVAVSQLQPQPLETVSKDEDPVYGPLGRARVQVVRGIVSDNEISPDLASLFTPSAELPYISPPAANRAFNPMRNLKTVPIPDALLADLNYKHLPARMGIFEEIERAWFTIGPKLFLWNYNDGRDFSRYDQATSDIQVVGLVRARKDVFIDNITHLLIIATDKRTKMLGISQDDKGELSMYATDFDHESPAQFTDVLSTDSGRIFLLGHNRDLYELEYTASSGWFGNGTKMWFTNRTSSVITNWVPTFFSQGSKEGIEKVVVDPQQNRLYALQTNGHIEWFDVSGTKFESRGKYVHCANDLQRLQQGGAAPSYPLAKIVTIAPVLSNESSKVWLVAISANGTRLYLGTAAFYTGHGVLSLIGHRPPPPGCTKADANSFYSSGTMITVKVEDTSKTTVQYVTAAPGRISSQRENANAQSAGQALFQQPILQEWVESEALLSQVWTIAEVTKTNPAFSPPALRKEDNVALSPLPREATVGARQFLILTNSGMTWVQQPRPVDMMQEDVQYEKDSAADTCRAAFGRIQVAAMALQIGSEAEGKQPESVSFATNTLFTAEPPSLQTSTNGVRTITYSSRHDGFALSIARLLRPIWNVKVTVPAAKGTQKLGVSEKTLLEVQANLARLSKYVDDHPFPRHQADGELKVAWEQEELSVHGLKTLLKHSIEAISFVLLLADYRLPDIVAKCSPETQQAISGLTFQGLLTSQSGREIARQLVTALIELQIGAELSIDTLSSILQQRCGTFVQPGDVVLYKAQEALQRAEKTRDPIERSEQLSESLRLFGRATDSAPRAVYPQLPEITSRYRALKDIRGAIELPLRVATEIDRNDKAGDYVRDGRHADDPRGELFREREQCYALVAEALGEYDAGLSAAVANDRPGQAAAVRDEAYALAIESDDELWHFYLYDWIVEMGRPEQLLEFATPFIESYLRQTFSTVPERRDLLWKFYARREEYLKAAKALEDLAQSTDSSLSLEERVYYLAQALTNAQSAACVGSEDVEFLTGLQERVDVAQVQLEVVRSIDAHPGMSPAEKAGPLASLDAGLLTLDELYNDYAAPLRLFEAILLILKTADTRVEAVCSAVWLELLRSREENIPALAEYLTDLLQRFYPSEAAPLDIVLPLVYGLASELKGGEPGWATRALLAGGVGAREVWDAIVALSEETDNREFYAQEAAVVLDKWTKGEAQLPPAEVEQFTTSFLLRYPGAGDQTRKTLQKAKDKAATY